MKNTIKQIILIVLIIIIIGAIVLSLKPKKEHVLTPEDNMVTTNIENEKLLVEQYIKENISTLATDKPVLGGTWYVVSINIDPNNHTGELVYEDGHIQSKATLTYTYQENPQSIAVTKWEVKK